jgi:hypothetical protein
MTFDPKTSPAVPIAALFGDTIASPNMANDPRPALKAAGIIFARDVMTKEVEIVYGRDLLKQIVSSGQTNNVNIMVIEIDYDTDELEQLAALVQVLKGDHDLTNG